MCIKLAGIEITNSENLFRFLFFFFGRGGAEIVCSVRLGVSTEKELKNNSEKSSINARIFRHSPIAGNSSHRSDEHHFFRLL